MKDTRALRIIERQLVIEQGDCFELKRHFPVVIVLVVSSVLLTLSQFFPQALMGL